MAIEKRIRPDARYTRTYRNARKPVAITERIIPDARYIVGNGHARKPTAAIERIISDTSYTGRNHNISTAIQVFYPSQYTFRIDQP